MRYAKLINSIPTYAPNPILHNGLWYGNPPPEVYLAEGYKPVTYTDQPEPQGVGWYVETWTESDDAIVQGWEWHEATDEDEISPEEALDMLLGGESG
jgi:hypothetical protein